AVEPAVCPCRRTSTSAGHRRPRCAPHAPAPLDDPIIWMMTISWAVRHGKAAARSAMARLSRAELQEVNRAKVLAAADAEFAERGFRDAKVDAIAERAELTRGAVYSNFPGKRALYFAVLAERAERAPAQPPPAPGGTVREAL